MSRGEFDAYRQFVARADREQARKAEWHREQAKWHAEQVRKLIGTLTPPGGVVRREAPPPAPPPPPPAPPPPVSPWQPAYNPLPPTLSLLKGFQKCN